MTDGHISEEILLPGVPWVESPFFEQELARRNLTEKQAEEARFFHREGYLVVDLEIPGFDALAERIVARLAGRYGPGERRLQDAWAFDADVRALACHAPVLDRLRRLYGREPIPFQTLNFRVGTEQPLHSDALHFDSVPERFMCGVWVALEDIDADNGPLEYLPGSHRLPIYRNEALGIDATDPKANERERYGPLWTALGELYPRVRLELARGKALIWAANLIHGGAPQRDRARTRHSQVTHYYFEGCSFWTPLASDPALARMAVRDIVDIRAGAPVPNRYAGAPIPRRVRNALDPDAGVYPRGAADDSDAGEAVPAAPPAACGSLDAVSGGVARGWAWDPARPAAPVTVEIRAGETVLATARADGFRSDLLRAGIGNGCHGFACPVNVGQHDGEFVVHIVETGEIFSRG